MQEVVAGCSSSYSGGVAVTLALAVLCIIYLRLMKRYPSHKTTIKVYVFSIFSYNKSARGAQRKSYYPLPKSKVLPHKQRYRYPVFSAHRALLLCLLFVEHYHKEERGGDLNRE